MKENRCWTDLASEVPDVDDVEWEVEPTLSDFTGGTA